jgi:hypothetical protein
MSYQCIVNEVLKTPKQKIKTKNKINHNDGNKQVIFGELLVQNLIHLARPSHGRFILRGGYGKNHHT